MIPLVVNYATPSTFESSRERSLLGLSANARRPVRFHGRVKEHVLSVRLALQALGELVWSDDTWLADQEHGFGILDPVCTVHRDRIFFEAFSQDQSAYGLVILDRGIFAEEGEVTCGTTNVDFTAWLWAALAEMRSSRETWIRIEKQGLEVRTEGAGGRFEQKVELPESWVRGFLQLQGAMALPGTVVGARPVDVLAAIRFLRFTKAKVSPRAVRYVFEPGQPVQLVLEPWEQRFELKGTEHGGETACTLRTWGRRRLKLIEGLLPYAERVEIFLKGRALPSFYAVRLPGATFVLGLTGWTSQGFTGTSSFDLLTSDEPVPTTTLDRAHAELAAKQAISVADLAAALNVDKALASRALFRLCRQGRAIFDVQRREFRHRELFEEPINEAKLFPPDARREAARAWVAQGKVQVQSATTRETRKTKNLKTPEGRITRTIVYRDWQVTGAVADQGAVEIVVNDEDRILFGTCGCPLFKENFLNLGPCEHMVALLSASQPLRKDLSTSEAAEGAAAPKRSADDEAGDEEGAEADEDEALDGEGEDDENA